MDPHLFSTSLPFVTFCLATAPSTVTFRFCSENISRFFHLDQNDIAQDGMRFFSIFSEDDKRRLLALLQESPATSPAIDEIQHEFSYSHEGERSRRFLLQASAHMDGEARVWSGGIFSIDASYRRQEAAIKTANHFSSLQDHLPDYFYYKDANSRYLGGNLAWRAYHGFLEPDSWIGHSDLDSKVLPREEAERFYKNEQDIFRTGQGKRTRERLMSPQGQLLYLDTIKVPFYDDDGELLGLVGLTRDITEQVMTELDLAKAKAAAEQAALAKSSFLAVMSHEIRTPMNGVIGCASLLAETPLSDEQAQLVNTIQASGEGLLVIINDILDYSKIDAGQMSLDPHPFHLRNLIEDTLELFSKQVSDKGLELNWYIEPETPLHLMGDSSRIRQVLINLVGNAVKFTEEGEVTLNVSSNYIEPVSRDVKTIAPQRRCELLFSVNDTGIGILSSQQQQLFQAFTQADASITRRYGGTGLGLAISKKIVEQMQGDIWLESNAGKGSQFSFRITLQCSDHIDDDLAVETALLRGLHALVVDDNTTNRKILSATLAHWGMHVTAHASGEAALENILLGHRFDIAILDQSLSSTLGITLSDPLNSLNNARLIPSIILSSAADRLSQKFGPFISVQKPARTKELVRAMLEALKLNPVKPLQRVVAPVEPRKARVLVVEDNTINQMVLVKMLRKLGYSHVTTACDGDEAVAHCEDLPVDIIFMDIQMRVMDGYTATERIRALPHVGERPWIIALTAGVQEEDTEKAYQAGMNAFATKPIVIEALAEVLEEAESALASSKHSLAH